MLVVDGHNDLAWEMRRSGLPVEAIADDLSATSVHTDIPRLRAGGVGAQFWSVYVPCELAPAEATVAVLEQIDLVRRFVAAHPTHLAMAYSADDVLRVAAEGRVASLLGAEGGHCIAGSLGVLRMLHAVGVRYLTLTHARNTPWADSATDTPTVGGLSAFGHDVVREMNRLGMLVDLSHVAPSTMHAALDTSTAPAFFSHSSARALCDHPRNVPDDVLVRVRESEGIVMVTFVPDFLVAEPGVPATVGHVADHVEHVREVAGVDCVGLGGDFDGIPEMPEGIGDVSAYPLLLATLAGRGWSDEDLHKLAWENCLRVMRATEAAATC